MCGCIDTINAERKPEGQVLNATMFAPRRPLISLVRTDKHIIENRRSKPGFFVATFCPFCGEKYALEADIRSALVQSVEK
ncbi:hypothetical protein [Nitrobacter sp. TKz-YC02]|uniref:hypothetical protein n=1 Tax=Nitrobacter sp. TKz-YC02 TaxID=3398704 RepID=UPI003CF29627